VNPSGDRWQWSVRLFGQTRSLTEQQLGSIHNVDGPLVEWLELNCGMSTVSINMLTCEAKMPDGSIVPPLMADYGYMTKIPVFFRRMGKRVGVQNKAHVIFRALGYAAYHQGKLVAVPVIRVYDEAIERHFYSAWRDKAAAAQHGARNTLILQ